MKYVSISILTAIVISGCQLTDQQNKQVKPIGSPEFRQKIASPTEITQALLMDEIADVIHPVDDIEIELSYQEAAVKNDIWQRIRGKLSFEIPQNRRVVVQRNWYAKHQKYLDRVAKRAEPFIHYIVEEIEASGIPMEIALLPIVESAFDPFAYSHGRASGMWQFVPETGKRFGMKQNWWYDGRRDVIASTHGAIKYLQYLHKFFDGDWLLALAAYNSGEGRVKRAIRSNARRNIPTDFWSLDLPKETRAYVPKLLALADIIKRPEAFNVKLYALENAPVIKKVDVGSQIDLAKAAKLADLTLTELQHLNPGFNQWATDPNGPHYLVIPVNKASQFTENLNKLGENERLSWQRYQIKNGDSLGIIAQKFNTDVGVIKAVNDLKSNRIRAGKHLLIPVASASLDNYILSKRQRLATKQNRQREGIKRIHVVKKGDTLWDISRAYNVNYKSLAKWNSMAPKDTLKLGQKLVLWQKATSQTNVSHNTSPIENVILRNITYRVRKGDSFARIANKFNVTISDIEQWNSLSRKDYLQPGQMLKLAIDVTNSI